MGQFSWSRKHDSGKHQFTSPIEHSISRTPGCRRPIMSLTTSSIRSASAITHASHSTRFRPFNRFTRVIIILPFHVDYRRRKRSNSNIIKTLKHKNVRKTIKTHKNVKNVTWIKELDNRSAVDVDVDVVKWRAQANASARILYSKIKYKK